MLPCRNCKPSLSTGADPSTGLGNNLHAQFLDLMQRLRARVGPQTTPDEQLRQDSAAVEQHLAQLGTPPHGLALFSCAAHAFFREVRLPVRVRPNAYWGETPYLRPLLAVLDEFERTIVVLVDKEKARFFRVFLQQIEEIADLIEPTPAKHRQHGGAWAYPPGPDWTRGGWSDSGIVRHEETHVLWHARHAVATLARLTAQERVDRVIIGGTPEVLAEFRRLLPRPLRMRVVEEDLRVPLFARPAEVLAAVQELTERAERVAEVRVIDDLCEALGTGRAVAGPAAVVDAVLGQRVYLLIIGADARLQGRTCTRCTYLAPRPAPDTCPICGGVTHHTPDLIEHLIQRVLEQGGRVEEVRGTAAERLEALGGIAALQRYVLPVVTASEQAEA
jgi:peptide chain release factor subunit 1